MFLLVRFPMCIDRNSGNNDLTQGLVGRVKFLPWPTSPGYSLDQLQPCAHTGSHLKAPLHFSGSLSLGHMAHMAAMKMHLCHPQEWQTNWPQLQLWPSEIHHHSSCFLWNAPSHSWAEQGHWGMPILGRHRTAMMGALGLRTPHQACWAP